MIVLPGYENKEERVLSPTPKTYAWIIGGSGTIVIGRKGIDLSGGNSIVHPSLQLAADQAWTLARPPSRGPWAPIIMITAFCAYWKMILRHYGWFRLFRQSVLVLFGDISGPGGIRKRGEGAFITSTTVRRHSAAARRSTKGCLPGGRAMRGTTLSGLVAWCSTAVLCVLRRLVPPAKPPRAHELHSGQCLGR